MVSAAHNVCPKGYYVAIVSTIAEQEANHHIELQPGFERLGQIEETFMAPPIALYEPLEDGTKDNIYISKSYDATSHFETTTGKCIYLCFMKRLVLTGLQTTFATSTNGLKDMSSLSRALERATTLSVRSECEFVSN